jgi:hypothetical protein
MGTDGGRIVISGIVAGGTDEGRMCCSAGGGVTPRSVPLRGAGAAGDAAGAAGGGAGGGALTPCADDSSANPPA